MYIYLNYAQFDNYKTTLHYFTQLISNVMQFLLKYWLLVIKI